MKYGLLQGLGQGMAQVGAFGLSMAEQQAKQQWMERYQLESEARQNQRQDTMRSEDRANKLADDQAALDQTKDIMEDVKDDSGNLLGQRNKHTGEFKPFTQKSTSQRPVSNGNAVYDPNTGSWSQNPYAEADNKDAKHQADIAKSIIASIDKKRETGELTDEDNALYRHAAGVLSGAMGYKTPEPVPAPTNYSEAYDVYRKLNPGASDDEIAARIKDNFGFSSDTKNPAPQKTVSGSDPEKAATPKPEDAKKEKRYQADPFVPFREAGGLLKQGAQRFSEGLAKEMAVKEYKSAVINGGIHNVETDRIQAAIPLLKGEDLKAAQKELARRGVK